MGDRIFGDAADKVIVEECLRGIEASMLCFVDGKTIVPMESAQDYKRILTVTKVLIPAAWAAIRRASSSRRS